MKISIAQLIARDVPHLAEQLGLDPTEARLDVQVLLCEALNVPRAYLAAHRDEALPEPAGHTYAQFLARRLQGEPVAYILGRREFFSLPFQVSPAVLIPRPDTELLVELALARIPPDSHNRLLDLGTGSGAIAITLARQRPKTEVIAVDRSRKALEIAQKNARALQVTNVSFVQGNWCAGLGVRIFDIIVANPPYIRENDPHLAQGDLRFEPIAALVADDNGLASIKQIACSAPAHLCRGGYLMLEHGYDQAEACRSILIENGFSDIESMRDLAGIERATLGKLE